MNVSYVLKLKIHWKNLNTILFQGDKMAAQLSGYERMKMNCVLQVVVILLSSPIFLVSE